MPKGTTTTTSFGYVAVVDGDGNVVTPATGPSGSKPAGSSQSVTPASDGNPFPVVGNVAPGDTDSGNPVKIGGFANSGAPPQVTSGQRVNSWFSPRGSLSVFLSSSSGTLVNIGPPNSDALTLDAQSGVLALSANVVRNPASGMWVRQPGDTTGTYVVNKGGSSIATGQVAVTTSSTLVAAARSGRSKITLTPTTNVVFYVGTTGVTTTTGLYVPAGAAVTLDTAADVFAVGASSLTISFIEFF